MDKISLVYFWKWYYPEELVIAVKAGTPIAQIKKQLERNNQPLPFYTNDDSVSIGAVYLMADKIYPTAC